MFAICTAACSIKHGDGLARTEAPRRISAFRLGKSATPWGSYLEMRGTGWSTGPSPAMKSQYDSITASYGFTHFPMETGATRGSWRTSLPECREDPSSLGEEARSRGREIFARAILMPCAPLTRATSRLSLRSQGHSARSARIMRSKADTFSNHCLLRRWRREDFTLRGFWFRLRLWCFLGFFLAFIFVSHKRKHDTEARSEKSRKGFPAPAPHRRPAPR